VPPDPPRAQPDACPRNAGARFDCQPSANSYLLGALDEEDRRAINEWIRAPGHFDSVIDWDAVMRDPNDPSRLKPEFDSGDHIHPSPSGYRAMVDAIPMGEFLH
jgi:lysophospholipase L1-like esterase